MAAARQTVIEHPNRETSAARTMRVVVILLLLLTATVVTVVTVGGWDALESAKGVQIAFVGVDVLLAVLVWRWRRGVLPVAAALAVVLGIFAGVAAPAWFARDKPGFTAPGLGEDVLGFLCGALVPIQVILVVAALYAFGQRWNVEIERPAPQGEPVPA